MQRKPKVKEALAMSIPNVIHPKSKKEIPPVMPPLQSVISALPIFGGTSTETTVTESPPQTGASAPAPEPDQSKTADGTAAGGGDSAPALTPEQISDLVKQVSDLNNAVKTLRTENDTFKSKEEEARRASQSREQTLQEDNERLQQTVEAMDSVIKRLAVINAIQQNSDLQFHDARDVISRLNPDEYELSVDLEAGTATVNGIDTALKRIARESDWLVKKNNLPSHGNSGGGSRSSTPRGTGSPPAPSPPQTDKATRRGALIDKFPVIAHGRR